ncbi:MAG: cation:proton antiporter domain-containing protein [Planktomarina sp.]
MDSFLFQATLYLGASLAIVPIAVRLGLGSVLGYLVAGILIGPVFGLVGSETNDLQHFAEFGVVMMLFIIGLELEPKALWEMRTRLIGLGGLQVGVTAALITAGGMIFGLAWQTALAVGLILALSSTAIVLQTLAEKGLMNTPGGRSAFSVLLTQDIAVIPMLAALPLLAIGTFHGADPHAHDAAHASLSLVDGLPAWGVTLVTLGAVGAVILAGLFLIRPLFHFVSGAHLRELHTAFALLIVVGIAFLMILVGLSPALGTFLAGVVLANSEFRHQLESDIEPFKGLLLGLFFITVGAGINFAVLFGAPATIIGLTFALILIKAIVLYAITLIFKIKGRAQILFTLSLAQAGEFGFVLLSFAVQQSVLPVDLSQTLLLVVALSMLLTPVLFILHDRLAPRLGSETVTESEDTVDEQHNVIIAGIGRFGQVVNRMLRMAGYETTVLDHDLQTVKLMRTFGFKGFYGDPTRPDILHAAGIDKATVLVVALDNKAATIKLVKYARSIRPDLHIVARAADRVHVYELYQAGANDIVREMFDSSLRAGRYALEHLGMNDYEASVFEHSFFKEDRRAVRELAALWDPKVPIRDNKAYVERAKELNKEMETGIVARLQEDDGPKDVKNPLQR